MSKNVAQFPFYINYMDVDLYCFWLMDYCGEDSALAQLIDGKNFMDQCDNPQKYKKNADELLLEIRQCLVDSGFEKEVEACDKTFMEERRERGVKSPYIPMHKRWEQDDEAAKKKDRVKEF